MSTSIRYRLHVEQPAMRRWGKTGGRSPSPPPFALTGPSNRSANTESRASRLSPQAAQTLREQLQLALQRAQSKLRGPLASDSPEAARTESWGSPPQHGQRSPSVRALSQAAPAF